MKYVDITTDEELTQFCDAVATCPRLGFDTEFVSEDTFVPDLCLIQVSAGNEMAVIDTKLVSDLTPFWNLLTSPGHETIVHAAREEYLFCQRAMGVGPSGLIDLQIAAGLIGLEYPASYGNLVSRFVGKTVAKGETRTDWRRRPLTRKQIEYALQDVLYLEPLRDKLFNKLEAQGRMKWLEEEMQAWKQSLEEANSRQRWRRVSGISGLSPRSMAIVRELWHWREAEALRTNLPPKRLLRDDLIVEMARRQTADVGQIRAVRGMNRRDIKPHMEDFGRCIKTALDLPASELPYSQRREVPSQVTVLSQFLGTALGSICREASVAASLVGTVQDVRDLIAFRLDLDGAAEDGPPRLAKGWRAEVVGHLIEDLLGGKVAMRIKDPLSDYPLVFETRPQERENS